ncbi:aldehyde dehydrogenase family protein [Micromonospora sp. NPDC049662]|uniref:aldehyde dehydrogenase family protein n=1 Tax=Micromonospora sp. NPDC049662 TaxID=3155397 RepID=UPI0034322C34
MSAAMIAMTIDGRSQGGDQTIDVEDPATEEIFTAAPHCTQAQLAEAVGSCRTAFRSWSTTPIDTRREYLRACGDVLAARRDEIAELLTREQGKPLSQARAEVDLSAGWFGHTAVLPLGAEVLVDDQSAHIELERVPHGVVAAITPFNYPIILGICKLAPALLAGNTVLWKPSPVTPLSSLLIGELLRDVLPPGVLNVVSGGGDLGRSLVTHPDVALVSFTGSVATGRAIASAVGLRHVVLELGGNDPAIVLPNADVGALASSLFTLATLNSGQFCAAIKRVYVHRAQQAELFDALASLAGDARLGSGFDPRTTLGPLTTRSQLDRLTGLVEAAVAAGGRAAGGRKLAGPGHFYPATVVTDLPTGTQLESTEQFGPVIPVLGYDDPAQAVAAANATEYGLGASVWGDPDAARSLSSGIDAGTVWLNTHGDLRHDVPFGGARSSGRGVEYGYLGLLEYTRVKVVNATSIPG